MLLAEILNTLAGKTGTKTDSEEFKKIIAATSAIEVPEDITKQLSGLINLNEAKNDSMVKNHYFAQFADAFDPQIEKLMESIGLDRSAIDEIKAAEKPFKRMGIYQDKVGELLKKQAGSNSKKEVEQYQTEINALNKRIKDEAAAKDKVIEDLNKNFESREIDWTVGSLIPRDKLKSSIPEKFRLQNAKQAIDEFIAKSGAKITKGENGLKLVRANDTALDYTEFDLKTLIEKGLAESDMFETSAGQSSTKTIEIPKKDNTDIEAPHFANFKERIEQSKNDFKKAI